MHFQGLLARSKEAFENTCLFHNQLFIFYFVLLLSVVLVFRADCIFVLFTGRPYMMHSTNSAWSIQTCTNSGRPMRLRGPVTGHWKKLCLFEVSAASSHLHLFFLDLVCQDFKMKFMWRSAGHSQSSVLYIWISSKQKYKFIHDSKCSKI